MLVIVSRRSLSQSIHLTLQSDHGIHETEDLGTIAGELTGCLIMIINTKQTIPSIRVMPLRTTTPFLASALFGQPHQTQPEPFAITAPLLEPSNINDNMFPTIDCPSPFVIFQQRWFQLLTSVRALFRQVIGPIVLSVALWGLVQYILVKRRQSKDATSEWARYARYPMARGRALARLVLGQLLPLVGLAKLVPISKRGRRFQDFLYQWSGRLLANGLLKVGPLYIKLGQILSCREKFLPDQWKTAMEKLQDQVPSRTGQDALDLAYSAWPGGKKSFEATFSEFDTTPLAAASLGQVHWAVLASTGDVVAVKLQRPYLREIYDQDLAFLTKIAAMVDKFGGTSGKVGGVEQSWVDIFKDARKILYREIDYRDEAKNAVRFYTDFGITKYGEAANSTRAVSEDGNPLPSAAPWLRTPYVYEDLCSEKVLVMEYVPSIKITNSDQLKKAGVTVQDREYLAEMLGRAYLRQFCCNRFFSTDPHPGNLGVEIMDLNEKDPAKRVRLVFYDFGQASSLTVNQADGIQTMIEAIVDMDVERSVEAFQEMGVLKDGANLDQIRAKVADNYKVRTVSSQSVLYEVRL